MKIWMVIVLAITVFLFTGCTSSSTPKDQETTVTDSTAIKLNALSKAIENDPKDARPYHNRARFYLMGGDLDDALKDINKAITLDNSHPDYYLTLSDIQLLMGQSDNCMAAINKAVSLDPSSKEARLRLAKLYLILQNYPATYRVLNEMIRSDKFNPKAYFIRSIALLEQGDTAKAVGDLMKAVDQDQQYYEAFVQLGELFSIRNDSLAEGYLRNALRILPASTEALYMLGLYYQNSGQYEKAFSMYDRLFTIDSTFRSVPFNKGYIYLVYLQDFPLAISLFTEAIAIDSSYTDAWYNRGYAYELNGEPELAYRDFQTVLRLDVNNERAIEGLNRLDKSFPGK